MKKIDWSHADRLKNLIDSTTPFVEIECPSGEVIRQFYTTTGQVQTLVYHATPEAVTYGFKSSGHGYDRSAEGLEKAFRLIGKKPRGFTEGGATSNLSQYHVGGNFHRIAKKDWLKY